MAKRPVGKPPKYPIRTMKVGDVRLMRFEYKHMPISDYPTNVRSIANQISKWKRKGYKFDIKHTVDGWLVTRIA